jgi:glycosyltransferase involved in cell wall biosynthesis
MKILHIISTIDPASGGPSESVRLLLGYGVIGYTGEVVTLDSPDAPFLKDLPFPVHALGPSSAYGFSTKLLQWLRENRHRFDGVVVNGLWRFGGFAAWRTISGHKPYLVFTHGMLDPYFKRAFPLKHLKKAIYWYLIEYWVLLSAFRVLFTTEVEERLAHETFALSNWKSYVVPYGSGGPITTRADALNAFHKQMPSMLDKRFLLFLGRIHPKKGCDMLLEAFAQIADRDPELHLVMAGPDQIGLQESLTAFAQEHAIADRIHWPGMVRDRAKWGAFYACEAFILPSHQENFGIAVAEALACGRPVLLSDQVNIAPEIASDGSGYVEPDTPSGTLSLLERWLDTPQEQRERMASQALTTFDKRYDMRENAKALINLFQLAQVNQD